MSGAVALVGNLPDAAAATATTRSPSVTSLSPTSGPLSVGTKVTLHGTGFSRRSIVYFGTVRATKVTALTSRTLTAAAPAHTAGTVSVRVRSGSVLSATSTRARFSFVAPPVVTSLSSHYSPVTGNTAVTITGHGFTAGSKAFFGSVPARRSTVSSSTRILAVTPVHAAGSAPVRVAGTYGSSTVVAAAAFSFGTAPTITSVGTVTSGQTVHVTGENLTGVTSVRFGAVAARSFQVRSATSLDAVAPDVGQASSVEVEVGSPYGDSRPYETAVYLPPPTPTPPPPAIADFAVSLGQGSIDLTWQPYAGNILLERVDNRSATNGFRDSSATQIDVTGRTSYSDTGAQPGVYYSYTLFGWGAGAVTSPAELNFVRLPAATPPIVDQIRALPYGPDAVALDWHDAFNSDFAGVTIRRAVGTTPPATVNDGTLVADEQPASGSVLDDSLAPGTQYAYSFFAVGYHTGTAQPGTATVTTSGAGHGWSAPAVGDPRHGGPGSLSCPTDTFCAAGDVDGNVLTWDGTTWARPVQIDRGHPILSISCTSPEFCVAVDDYWRALSFNGTTWTRPVGLFTAGVTSSPNWQTPLVSCASASFCVSVAQSGVGEYGAVLTTDSAGQLHSVQTGELSGPANSVLVAEALSCPVQGWCAATTATGEAAVFTAATNTWAVTSIDTYTSPYTGRPVGRNITSLSCTTATFCVAVDDTDAALRYDGSSWTDMGTPVAQATPTGGAQVSCSTNTSCLLVAGTYSSSYDGSSWSALTPITTTPVPDGGFATLSCGTGTSSCRGIDYGGRLLSYTAGSWSAGSTVDDAGGGASSVSCVDASWCLAVDFAGEYFITDGSSWPDPRPAPTGLQSVSCVSRTFCVAAQRTGGQFTGYQGSVVVFNGQDWFAATVLQGASYLVGLSCVSSTSCTAIDSGGRAYDFDGSGWSTPVSTPLGGATGLSCAADGFCAAVGGDGNSVEQRVGGTWTVGISVIAYPAVTAAVSCTSSTFCMVVTSVGSSAVWNGTVWTKSSLALDLPAGSGVSVSCGAPDSCVALVGQYAQFWDGASWTLYRTRFELDVQAARFAGETVSMAPGTGRALAVYGDGVSTAFAGP